MLERVTRCMEEKSTNRSSWAAKNHLLGGNAGASSASISTLWLLKKSCSMELSSLMFLPCCKLLSDHWETVTVLCWTGYVSLVLSPLLLGSSLTLGIINPCTLNEPETDLLCGEVQSLQTRTTQGKEMRHIKEIGCSFWQCTPSDKVQGRVEHSYSSVLLSYSGLPNSQDEQSCPYLMHFIS